LPNTSPAKPYISLDATLYPVGARTVWTNHTPLGWNFVAATNNLNVQVVDGSKGVVFPGGGGAGALNYFTGPPTPQLLTGGASRTLVAWIYNPTPRVAEETIFAWGRRGGPDGSNSGFSHGTEAAFGAIQFWGGGPDVPWGTNAAAINTNLINNAWTFVGYTYDSTSGVRTVYKNGQLANQETNIVTINTHMFDPADPFNQGGGQPIGRALPFRIGAQNDTGGGPFGAGPFANMTISRIRAYDVVLTAADIATQYNTERVEFPGQPRITNVRVSTTGVVQFDWVVAPTRTYAVETNSSVVNPAGWGTLATGQSSGSFSHNSDGKGLYYRMRLE
jgi:hypothetical protein